MPEFCMERAAWFWNKVIGQKVTRCKIYYNCFIASSREILTNPEVAWKRLTKFCRMTKCSSLTKRIA